MSIANFPSLSPEEFSEACHHLERTYCQTSLGPERRRWKLRTCTALDTDFTFEGGYTTYVQIRRPLQIDLDHGDLSLDLDSFSFSENTRIDGDVSPPNMDRTMMDAEEADEAALVKHQVRPDAGMVEYEIHLHPTYRVPCLWFTLCDLPANEPAFSIDTVFRRLVPDEYKAGLRSLGGVGGISADVSVKTTREREVVAHHPLTGIPSFFVHPCLLGDAISHFECNRANYLTIWLGLVGGCVGLWIPKEMALQ